MTGGEPDSKGWPWWRWSGRQRCGWMTTSTALVYCLRHTYYRASRAELVLQRLHIRYLLVKQLIHANCCIDSQISHTVSGTGWPCDRSGQ